MPTPKGDPTLVKDQLQALQAILKSEGAEHFMMSMFWILTKDKVTFESGVETALIPYRLNRIQRHLNSRLGQHNLLLKARQIGGTTFFLLRRLLLNAVTNSGKGCLLISQSSEYAEKHFQIARRAYKMMGMVDPMDKEANQLNISLLNNVLRSSYSNRREIVLEEIESRLMVASAEVEESGQGMCLHPETLIITKDFEIKPFKDLAIGDKLRNAEAKITQVTKLHNIPADTHPYKGVSCKIHHYGMPKHPIVCAVNHPFLTQRGWVKAEDLRPRKDYFKYPKTKITGEYTYARFEKNKAPRAARNSGDKFDLDREFGFFCGFVLADGGVRGNRVISICMKNPRKQKDVLPRIEAVLGRFNLTAKKFYSQENTLECLGVNSATLAKWFLKNFGRAKNKHVPVWWYRSNKEFLTGLLEGWLNGDGYVFKYPRRGVEGYARNSKLLLGMRELSISLGFGMPKLYVTQNTEKTRTILGTVCNINGDNYKLGWGGNSFYAIADMLGVVYPPRKTDTRRLITNYQDEDYVYTLVRKIENVYVDCFKDITVDDEEHLYCLPYGVTHNTLHHIVASEYSRWPHNPEATLSNVRGALVKSGTLDKECTANGAAGAFYEDCKRAMDDPSNSDAVFHYYGWYWLEDYEFKLTLEQQRELENDLNSYEISLIAKMHKELSDVAWVENPRTMNIQ